MLEENNIENYKQQLLNDFNSRTNYDKGRFYIPIAQQLIEFANLKAGEKILDIATGTGIVAFSAAEIVGNEGKVIGVDISAGMLSNARKKLADLNLKNLEFIEADAEFLEFSENSFDVILCSLALCYMHDIPAALSKWCSLLKPNGKLVFNAWLEKALTSSVLFRAIAARYGVNVPNPNFQLGTKQRCLEILQIAGFRDIKLEESQFGWYFNADANTAEEMWNANTRNVFGYQVQQLPSEKLAECKAEFIAEVQKLRITDKGVWCDAPIFFAKAFK